MNTDTDYAARRPANAERLPISSWSPHPRGKAFTYSADLWNPALKLSSHQNSLADISMCRFFKLFHMNEVGIL